MSKVILPPLRRIRYGKAGRFSVDELVPGLIVASPNHKCGEPTIMRTGIPTYAEWVWEIRDDPESLHVLGITRDHVIAACAFEAGRKWQRSRARR